MKKFYLSFIAATAMMSASAATIDCGEGQTYTTLDEAYGHLAAGDVVNLTSNTAVTGRIIANNAFTLEGNNYTVDRTNTNGNQFSIGNESSNTALVLQNVTFTASKQPSKYYFNFKGKPGVFNNVTISGVNNKNTAEGAIGTGDASILNAGGHVTLNGVKFVNCELAEGNYHVYAGSTLDLSGDNGGTIIYVAPSATVNATDLTNTTPIQLILGGQADGDILVKGCTDPSKFTVSAGTLEVNEGNLIVTGLAKEEDTNDAVFNQTKGKNYADLVTAVSSAGDGDVILVHANQNFTNRLSCGTNNITIKGDDGVTITNTANTIIFLASDYGGSFTLENLIIDGGNKSGDKTVIEASKSGAKVFLKDVTIKNVTTTNGQGIICNKGGATVSLENVTIENCVVPEDRGSLFVGTNNVTLKGNNSLTVYMEQCALNCQDISNSAAISVTLKTPTVDKTYVSGCEDLSKFVLTNEGFIFAKDGNGGLKAIEGTYNGISDIEADGTEPVVFYNLQGVRVPSDNLPAGIYLRRAGSKTTKVYVK